MKTRQSMQKARKKLLVLMFTEMMEMPVIVPETEKKKNNVVNMVYSGKSGDYGDSGKADNSGD